MCDPKTINILILETLADGEPRSAREIARLWGEDPVRVWHWLERFRRLGYCSIFRAAPARPLRPFGTVYYQGDVGAIQACLAEKARAS